MPFERSLFSGAGGGLLGTKLLGWQSVGYVENDDYCQRVLAQRIEDGIFEQAPIFRDIRAFLGEGFADRYQGLVDVLTAGFPCQPFSIAGNQNGEADERNLWPETLECIRRIRPRVALLENVPALLAHPYFGTILGDLAASGYCVRWDCLSAAALGAPIIRDRLWIVAGPHGVRCHEAADASRDSPAEPIQPHRPWRQFGKLLVPDPGGRLWCFPDADAERVFDGMADWAHRLKAVGNGQVPAVARRVWEEIGCEP